MSEEIEKTIKEIEETFTPEHVKNFSDEQLNELLELIKEIKKDL